MSSLDDFVVFQRSTPQNATYDAFVDWFLAIHDRRPTHRDVMTNADRLEETAHRKRLRAKHGGLVNRALDRALRRCDEYEDVGWRLRRQAPKATEPCACSCDCTAASAPLNSLCAACTAGNHYRQFDPDFDPLYPEPPVGAPYFRP